MLAGARLSRLPSPVQLKQGLIDKLSQETFDAKILQRPPLRLRKRHRCYWCRQMVEKDLSVHCLRWGQFFHQHCFIQHLEGLIDKPNQETVDAKILQRPPLQYVDGTRSLLNGDEPEDSLASLGAALRNAAESQRFFRSSAQWSAAWWKYVPTALSVSQLSWGPAITHADVVAQIVQTEREEARSGYLAAFYFELRRRQRAARAAKSDPNLDLADSLSRIDWPLLMARTRLDAALQAAGISQKGATATIAGRLPRGSASQRRRIAEVL